MKPLEYYYENCPAHPDRVWIKAKNVDGALCEVLPFNGQTAEECAMGLVLLMTTFGRAINKVFEEGKEGPCDEARRD